MKTHHVSNFSVSKEMTSRPVTYYHMPRNVTCKAHMWESHQRKRCTKDALPFQWSIFLPLQCCTCLVVLLNALHDCNYEALPQRSILSHNARRLTDASTDDADPDGSVPAPFNPTIPSLKTWSKQLNSRQRTTYKFTQNFFFKFGFLTVLLPHDFATVKIGHRTAQTLKEGGIYESIDWWARRFPTSLAQILSLLPSGKWSYQLY